MNYEILDNAETVSFSEIELHFSDFISKFVSQNRKDRWLALIKKQKQLSKKFCGLWDHLETENSSPLSIENLPEGVWLYYDGSNDPVYKISTQELHEACLCKDGIAFLPSSRLVILFTHEATEYVFKI